MGWKISDKTNIERGSIAGTEEFVIDNGSQYYALTIKDLESFIETKTETLTGSKTLTTSSEVVQILDPNGADRDVVLPAEASSENTHFIIINNAGTSGENLVVKDDGGSTIVTITYHTNNQVICNGTTWTSTYDPSVFLKNYQNLSDISNSTTAFNNIKQDATETYKGVTRYATPQETKDGLIDTKSVTPSGFQIAGDDRYLVQSNNLSDIGTAATAFDNIKQDATTAYKGSVELSTDAEAQATTATDKVVTPSNLSSGKLSNVNVDQVDGYDLPATYGNPQQYLQTNGVDTVTWSDGPSGTVPDSGSTEGVLLVGDGASSWGVSNDLYGAHLTGVQNFPDIYSNGPAYRLGSENEAYLSLSDPTSADSQLSFNDGKYDDPFSFVTLVKPRKSSCPLVSKGVYNSEVGEYLFWIDSGDKLVMRAFDESVGSCYIGTKGNTNISSTYSDVATLLAGTYDGSGASSGFNLYVNGYIETSSDDENNAGSYVATENLSGDCVIGKYDLDYADADFYAVKIFNLELDSSVSRDKSILNGGPVPYEYIGARKDNLWDEAAGNFLSGTYSWVTAGNNNISNENKSLKIEYVDSSDGASIGLDSFYDMTEEIQVSKRYRVSFNAKVNAGSSVIMRLNNGTEYVDTDPITNTTWQRYSLEYTSGDTTNELVGGNFGVGEILYIDKITMKQIGCISNLDPETIFQYKWKDSSGNDNDFINYYSEVFNATPIEEAGGIPESIYSTTVSLSAADLYGAVINNYGQSAEATYKLKEAQEGMNFIVQVSTAGNNIHIDPYSTDKIYLDGTALDDGDKVSNNATGAGEYIKFRAFKVGDDEYDWIAETGAGTWVDGG